MRFEPCKQNFKTHDALASHLRDSGKHKQNPNRSLISVPTTSGANVNQSQSTLGSNSAFDDLDLGGGLSVPKQLRNFKFMLGTLGSADKEKIAQLTKVTHDKITHSKMVFEVIRNRMYSALAQQLLPHQLDCQEPPGSVRVALSVKDCKRFLYCNEGQHTSR